MNIRHSFYPLMAPADDDDGSAGGAADRGDDFVSTGDDAPPKAEPAAKAEAEAEPAAQTAPAAPEGEGEGGEHKDEGLRAEDKRSKKDSRIPLSRHEQILARERARSEDLARQLAQAETAKQTTATHTAVAEAETALAKMEQEYAELIADNKSSEAAAKMAEIRKMERGIITQQNALDLAAVEARAVETVRYSTTLERIEAAFPILNEDHADYDKAVVAEVLDLKASFEARGYSRSVALQRAVKYVVGEPKTTRQEAAVEAEVRVDKDEVAKVAAKDLNARKEDGVRRNIDAALKTPPSAAKIGLDSDKAGGSLNAANAIKLPYNEFVKLDDATLARMRGDELV